MAVLEEPNRTAQSNTETAGRGNASPFLPYESEDDFREAAENFRAYLEILREWHEADRKNAKKRPSPSG